MVESDFGTGQHTLGPHVLNQRIVVRYLLDGEVGPSGGPAMTDVRGVCERWANESDPVVQVRREDGVLIKIPLRLIVSGKPIPPRPSLRLRTPASEIEAQAEKMLELDSRRVGEWVLRYHDTQRPRPFLRGLSALAYGAPERDFDHALSEVLAFYGSWGAEPLIQVETGSSNELELRSRGWRIRAHDEVWIAGISETLRGISSAVSVSLQSDDRAAVAWRGAEAEGRAYLHNDWLVLYNLNVDSSARRRYLGTAVMAELLEWGAEGGARTAWMSTNPGNEAGTGLIESIGFARHHGNRFFVPPALHQSVRYQGARYQNAQSRGSGDQSARDRRNGRA